MPRLADLDAVRRILQVDRIWSAFALADLTPGYVEHAEWHVPNDGLDALVLIYRAYEPPLFVPVGATDRVERLMPELSSEPAFYLSVPAAQIPSIEAAGYRLERRRLMHRMALDLERFSPLLSSAARPLGTADLAAIERLYADGVECGEQPEFFRPEMLSIGAYHGVYEGSYLVAAGGTHVLAPSERVAALGNIYVRRDFRRRGLGTTITSAVLDRVRRSGVDTIVLNVVAANQNALNLYKRVGFRIHCEFIEAFAVRE